MLSIRILRFFDYGFLFQMLGKLCLRRAFKETYITFCECLPCSMHKGEFVINRTNHPAVSTAVGHNLPSPVFHDLLQFAIFSSQVKYVLHLLEPLSRRHRKNLFASAIHIDWIMFLNAQHPLWHYVITLPRGALCNLRYSCAICSFSANARLSRWRKRKTNVAIRLEDIKNSKIVKVGT